MRNQLISPEFKLRIDLCYKEKYKRTFYIKLRLFIMAEQKKLVELKD